MTLKMKHCGGCDTDKPLSEFNIYKSGPRTGKPLSRCQECSKTISRNWRKTDPVKARKSNRLSDYKNGAKPASENKSCSAYLGCIIAETVLSHEFPGFKRMPYGNPGYDYECPQGYKIDVKSRCRQHRRNWVDRWSFTINKNTIPKYFLLLAWKDRESLKPEHLWLIPGYLINDKIGIGITDSLEGLAKWSKFERPLENVLECCDKLRDD